MRARMSPQLARAVDSGAWELGQPGRKLRPGRLVRIVLYERLGLNRAAAAMGLSQTSLNQWLSANGVIGDGKRRRPRARP